MRYCNAIIFQFMMIIFAHCVASSEENKNPASTSGSNSGTSSNNYEAFIPYTGNPVFQSDIQPILQNNCLTCHSTINAPGNGNGHVFDTYSVVKARFSEIKYQAVNYSFMPRDGNAPLTAVERGILLKWEQDGFPEN